MKPLDPQSGFARYAAQYDDFEKYWNSFEHNKLEPYFRQAGDPAPDGQAKKVLDAGAGTGRLSVKLAQVGAEVTALDISPEMLARLEAKDGRVTTVLGDVREMPFEDNAFDMVFSSLTLVHLKKIEPFMDEAYRVLKDDGLFILVNIHYRKPMTLSDARGKYTIACYNHFPRHVREAAEELAYRVEDEQLLTEGDDIWVSQILILRK